MCAMTGLNILPSLLWESVSEGQESGLLQKRMSLFNDSKESRYDIESSCKTQVAGAAATLPKRTYSLINLFSYSLHKKAAFTLAEVLITLGIIGVVAAMTMPALISNYKYMVLENQLKAAYSDLNKAAKLFQMHNDMSMSEYAAINNSKNALKEFSKEFTSILKTSDLIYSSTDEDGNTVGARPWHWKSISGSSAGGTVSACDVSGFFWDTQGRVISFDDAPILGENGPKVCIDINGEKAPNRYGADFFVFMFTTDGYVIPWGQEHKDNPAATSGNGNHSISKTVCKYTSSFTQQLACANYALINQHPTDSGKDYWHDFVRGR